MLLPEGRAEGPRGDNRALKSGGFAADKLLAALKPGDEVIASDPQGFFYYEDLRDAKHVVGLAGGSGITPFLSMAYALRDGAEDFELTLLYGSRDGGEHPVQEGAG